MKKFLLGLVAGFALAGLAGVVFTLSLARLGERRPDIPDDATLLLRLSGEIPERPPLELPFPIFDSQGPLTMHEIWEVLRKAAADSRIKAVVVMPRQLETGWGKLHELRHSLAEFRKSGKPLLVYLREPGAREYYLATAGERIFLSREDFLNVKGLRAELMFLRGTLDKLGVRVEIEHAGKYKDAGDTLTRSSMSPETREVTNAILDGIYGRLVATIAQARGKTPEQVRDLIDQGPFLADQALSFGLIDDLRFEDEMFDDLGKRLKQEKIRRVEHSDYARVSARSLGLEGKTKFAFVVAEGVIVRGGGGDGIGTEDVLASAPFIRMLRQVREDESIKGVILRVDSPGGDAVASDEMLREVRLLSRSKPLVISMSDLAASGGYYIAMSGDPILAYPDTLTGSIGVIYGKANLRGFYDKLGIQKELITRGRFADIDSDYQPLSEAGRQKLREGIHQVYRGFLKRVSEGRNKPVEQVEPVAQGRVWLGAQAREKGLLDELGGLDRAIEILRQKAKVPPDEKIRLVSYPPRRSVIEYLFTGGAESLLDARLRRMLGGFDLRPWREGGILRLMPYQIRID